MTGWSTASPCPASTRAWPPSRPRPDSPARPFRSKEDSDIDFNDTTAEAKFRAEARAFLERHTEPLAMGASSSGPFIGDDPDAVRRSKDWQALKFDHGWACLTWPTEYGGRGLGPMEQVIWTQEELRRRTPINIFTIGIGMLGPTLMKHGTDGQKERHLRKMARGDEVWCQLFSEPGAGSDVAGLTTRATRDGADWVLEGQKTWNTGAHFCRWGVIIVRTDPQVPKHRGLTCFIVDMESEGIDIRPIRQMDGGGGFNDVFFSGVRVPDENRLGAVDDGWRVAITTLMNERAAIGARGMAGFGPADLVRLAREVEGPRGKAIEDASVRERIADFHVRAAGLRYTTYRTLTALSRGETPGPENSIHKLVGSPLRQEMATLGVDLQGQAGSVMDKDYGAQAAWLAAPGMRLAGGTDEIMRNIIAERVLGLPAEPRVDKDLPFAAMRRNRA